MGTLSPRRRTPIDFFLVARAVIAAPPTPAIFLRYTASVVHCFPQASYPPFDHSYLPRPLFLAALFLVHVSSMY